MDQSTGVRITANSFEEKPMGLFWLENGQLSAYEFAELSEPRHPNDSLSFAFERLKQIAPTLPGEDARPVVTASQIMTTKVVTVLSSCPLHEAINIMAEHNIRHLPVVAEEAPQLVGIVSDRDALLASADTDESGELSVGQVMTTELLTASPPTEIRLLAETMVECGISCLPILDTDEVLAGIVTTQDVLRSIACHAPLDLWG